MWSLAIAGAQRTGTVCLPVGLFRHIGGRRPRKYSEVTGALVAGRGHVTEGAVQDTIGITPSDVNNDGRQGCWREVSAQEGDVHPSARSEPDVLNRHPEIEDRPGNQAVGQSSNPEIASHWDTSTWPYEMASATCGDVFGTLARSKCS